MITVNEVAQLKAVLRAVRMHCRECMGNQGNGAAQCQSMTCTLRPWAVAPVQIDLGDGMRREQWLGDAYDIVAGIGGGWWSDLRREVEAQLGAPWHPSWWGALSSAMHKDGWRRQDGGRQCKELRTRNNAREYYWQRKVAA